MRVLVIEDNNEIAEYMAEGLRQIGHTVDIAADGQIGLKRAAVDQYDVMIVDRMLPGLDGLTVVAALRRAKVGTPILFVTSLGGIDDRVEGLEAGGDDYLLKPFALAELLARVNTLGRRPALKQKDIILRAGDLEIDLIARAARRGNRALDLRLREFQILEVLIRHKGCIVTRSMLLEKVWDFDFDPKTTLVETHVSRLRTKIESGFDVPILVTVRGRGYRLDTAS